MNITPIVFRIDQLMKPISRRKLLIDSSAIAAASMLSQYAAARMLTPGATEGPFYPSPPMRLADTDSDLVNVAGQVEEAGGEILLLHGKLLSRQGTPLAGLRIEIWQCDVNGKYRHPLDRRKVPMDSGFQGFGHDITDRDGSYSFRTIKPAKYPGRTPHIHVKVKDGYRELLTTQFYIAGHTDNNRDFIFSRLSTEEAQNVSMALTRRGDVLETRIDVVV